MSELLRNISLQEEVYATPTESLWKGEWNRSGERLRVSVLCLRKSDPAVLASLQLYKLLSDHSQVRKYIVPLLENDSKTIVFSACSCTLEAYIGNKQSSLRNKDWFQRIGLPTLLRLLRALRLLHKQGIVHGNVSPRTIFFTEEERLLQLGDFRSARETTDVEEMKKDVTAMVEVAAYFFGNCTYSVGFPPGHSFTMATYEEMHRDLIRTIQESSQMSASDVYQRFKLLEEPVPQKPISISPAQNNRVNGSFQHPDASFYLEKIKESINTDGVSEAQLGEYIRRFQQLLPQLSGFSLQLVAR